MNFTSTTIWDYCTTRGISHFMNWLWSDCAARFLVLDSNRSVETEVTFNCMRSILQQITDETQLKSVRFNADRQYAWVSSYYIDSVHTELVPCETMSICLRNAREQLTRFNEDDPFDLSESFRRQNVFVSFLFLKIFLRKKDALDTRNPSRPIDFKESKPLIQRTLDALEEALEKDKPAKEKNKYARLTHFTYIPYFHQYMRYKTIMNSFFLLAGATATALLTDAMMMRSLIGIFSRDYIPGWAVMGLFLSVYGVMHSQQSPDRRINTLRGA